MGIYGEGRVAAVERYGVGDMVSRCMGVVIEVGSVRNFARLVDRFRGAGEKGGHSGAGAAAGG